MFVWPTLPRRRQEGKKPIVPTSGEEVSFLAYNYRFTKRTKDRLTDSIGSTPSDSRQNA